MKELLHPLLIVSQKKWFFALNWFLSFLLLNGIFYHTSCRKDLSRSGRFELTKSTVLNLERLDSILFIDAFYSSEIPGEYKSRLDLTKEVLREIAAVGGRKVKLRLFDPSSSEEDARQAQESGVEPQILEKSDRESASVKRAYLGIKLTLGAKSQTIPVAFFAEQIEVQILSSLRNLTRPNLNSEIAILHTEGSLSTKRTGNYSDKDSVGVFVNEILRREFGEINEFDPNQSEIPESTKVLLWFGSGNLQDNARYAIDQFLLRGGSLIVLAKTMDFRLGGNTPGTGMLLDSMTTSGVAQEETHAVELNSFLLRYGIQVHSDMIFDLENSLPIGSLVEIEPGVIGRYPYAPWIVASQKTETLSLTSVYTQSQESLLLPWSSSIELIPEKQKYAKVEPILFSSKEAESRANYVMLGERQLLQSQFHPSGFPYILGASSEGIFTSTFEKQNIPKGFSEKYHLSKTPDDRISRILVFGTPYLVSDLLAFTETQEIYRETNLPFLLNCIDILKGDKDLLSARAKQSGVLKMQPVSKSVMLLTNFGLVLGIPGLVCIYAFLRIRKRNLQGKIQ
ncbi:gliding motility ABC transporter [Leptospira perolatii]|uniref:Gliding motility ABC transporter n=1 Tax=Leptospira perolatii TaxID=2023191 RepID=A0A2M9ZMM9_9LEPT|nr:GldG family protein [Leptospira perolatii]PJZ70129.1 gliding motility ABC transporter [Leptospira perolatii]PJZ73318.1 gliding motility ABC transporter [Leptospira perolatii]